MKYAVFNLKILRNHSARTAVTVFFHKSVVPIKILQLSINLQVDLDDVRVSLPVSRGITEDSFIKHNFFTYYITLEISLLHLVSLPEGLFSLACFPSFSVFLPLSFHLFCISFFVPPFSPPLIHLTDVFFLSSYHTDCQMACYHCKSYYQNSSNTLTFVFCKNLCKKKRRKSFRVLKESNCSVNSDYHGLYSLIFVSADTNNICK